MSERRTSQQREPRQIECATFCEWLKLRALECGVMPECISRKETLYYDESGNIKHLIVKGTKLNNQNEDEIFVLGGVRADECISKEELKVWLGRTSDLEKKANHDLKGDFSAILTKENFSKIMHLIQDKGWHIHLSIVQILYYAYVDIIDSIDGLQDAPMEYKAVLYEALRLDIQRTVDHFRRYKYPNIAPRNIPAFLDGIIEMIDENIRLDAKNGIMRPVCLLLKMKIAAAKELPMLSKLQNNVEGEWVPPFLHFYRQEIIMYPKKELIFDEEKQVQRSLQAEIFTLNGEPFTNYRFQDSGTDPMIQVCDYVVYIYRTYVKFLNRREKEVEDDISKFDAQQMTGFRLLNQVLKQSVEYNPMFMNFVGSIHVKNKIEKYREKYG